MNDNIQRSIGNIEGKLDALIVAVGKSEAKADEARTAMSARMTASEIKADESRDAVHARLNTLEHKVEQTHTEGHATLRKVEAMEPDIEALRRMRTQGYAVAGTLTTLGALFGATLYSSKDLVVDFFRRVFSI
jgi:hypothetical protein